jgi:hypothetical protein
MRLGVASLGQIAQMAKERAFILLERLDSAFHPFETFWIRRNVRICHNAKTQLRRVILTQSGK